MRHGLSSVCTAALIGGLLSAGAAMAQSRPGWVDPPARAPQGEAPAIQEPAQGPAEESAKELARPSVKAERRGGVRAAETQDGTGMADRSARATPRRHVAEPVRPSRRETVRSAQRDGGARRHRRLAQVPAITPAAPAMAASEGRFPEWAGAAQRLAVDYLDSVSAPGDALVATAPRFYAERVRFHGRTLSLSAVMAEKSRFVRRWPVRHYAVQARSLHTACNAQSATCQVYATFEFRAENPARGARSQGVSELVLTIDVSGARPVIVAEGSRVVQRYGSGPLSAIGGASRGA